jgi:hypothetical protein
VRPSREAPTSASLNPLGGVTVTEYSLFVTDVSTTGAGSDLGNEHGAGGWHCGQASRGGARTAEHRSLPYPYGGKWSIERSGWTRKQTSGRDESDGRGCVQMYLFSVFCSLNGDCTIITARPRDPSDWDSLHLHISHLTIPKREHSRVAPRTGSFSFWLIRPLRLATAR